ncbi:MAG: hypothetical protein IK096_03135 [Lachnospiraceae bacterium]|nr:hypothetical protein [Lachnospiraceae bacterium]
MGTEISEGMSLFTQTIRITLLVIGDAMLIAAIVLGLRYYLHMLQLSSYQFRGFFRFFGRHRRYIVLHAVILILWPLLLLSLAPIMALILIAIA